MRGDTHRHALIISNAPPEDPGNRIEVRVGGGVLNRRNLHPRYTAQIQHVIALLLTPVESGTIDRRVNSIAELTEEGAPVCDKGEVTKSEALIRPRDRAGAI